MENKKRIVELYYNYHLKVIDIENMLNISSAYISRIIKLDNRYDVEKAYRKNLNKKKRRIAKLNYIKNKREIKRREDNYNEVLAMHNQDVKELSKSGRLSDEAYRKWNYSAYKYNPSKKRYEFDDSLGRSADVPKYIKER